MKLKIILISAIALVSLGGTGRAAETPAASDPMAMRGKRLFLRCTSCHNIGKSAIQRIGPNLHGVVGRKAGSLPGYNYSTAMKGANFIWDEATLDRWLQNPAAVVPGTAMAFGGLSKPEDRKAVILYLEASSS